MTSGCRRKLHAIKDPDVLELYFKMRHHVFRGMKRCPVIVELSYLTLGCILRGKFVSRIISLCISIINCSKSIDIAIGILGKYIF